MIYKDFEKELQQFCDSIAAKYIHTPLKNSKIDFHQSCLDFKQTIHDEIGRFVQKKTEHCDVVYLHNPCIDIRSQNYYISVKNGVFYGESTDFIHVVRISLIFQDSLTKGVRDCKIDNIQFKISRTPIFNSKKDSFMLTPHLYLKTLLNRKIGLNDDIDCITEKIRNELNEEYRWYYFDFLETMTGMALSIYNEHISKNDFLSPSFLEKATHYHCLIQYIHNYVINLNYENSPSLERHLKELILKKRIYAANFQTFENGILTDEKHFAALTMPQIRYQYHLMKNTKKNSHSWIQITATNVFTGKVKTFNDCAND